MNPTVYTQVTRHTDADRSADFSFRLQGHNSGVHRIL